MRRFGLLVLVLVLIFNWHRIGTRQAGYGDLGQARGMVTNIVKKKKNHLKQIILIVMKIEKKKLRKYY